MADIGIMIHTPITSISANKAVPGALDLKFETKESSYSSITIFTGDAGLAAHMAKAFVEYQQHDQEPPDAEEVAPCDPLAGQRMDSADCEPESLPV